MSQFIKIRQSVYKQVLLCSKVHTTKKAIAEFEKDVCFVDQMKSLIEGFDNDISYLIKMKEISTIIVDELNRLKEYFNGIKN